MATLDGIGVLVTRPEQQAMPLCRLLAAQGATTWQLPALEIIPVNAGSTERRALVASLGALESFDTIIFVSANAVRFGVSLLDQQRSLNLAVIGGATARALNQAGYRVAIATGATPDSEGLLSNPRFEHVSGHRILLIKGVGGRPLLEEELSRRGAQVITAEVYRRAAATPTPKRLADVHASFEAGAIQVVTATSVELAENLLRLATPELRQDLAAVHWLVASARIATAIREHGVTAPLLTAASAEDQDLVSELLRWRADPSVA